MIGLEGGGWWMVDGEECGEGGEKGLGWRNGNGCGDGRFAMVFTIKDTRHGAFISYISYTDIFAAI